jgi:hypothetical protein
LYSGAIVGGTGWNTAETTSTASGTGPDSNTAYQISETAISFGHSLINTGTLTRYTNGTSTVLGTVYTGSIFLKKVAGSVDWVQLTFGAVGFGTSQYANFNLSTGAYGLFTGLTAGTVPRIEAFSNGWYRCSITCTATATTTTSAGVCVAFTNNTNPTARLIAYLGRVSNSFLATMCQFEAGSFPTSYIPTTTASVIRSADVCSITGSDFSGMYNQPEGTLVTSSSRTSTNINAFIGHYSDNSFNNGFDVRHVSTTQVAALMDVANSNQVASMQVSITAGSVIKQAFSYKLNDCGYSVNGAATITDTSALIPTATRLGIGHTALASPSFYLNGTISSMRYFKKRLANAKLQTITV